MSDRRVRRALAAALAVFFVTAAIAFADDLLADGDGLAPVGPNVLDFGTVCAGTTSTKPVAVALKASNHPTDTGNIFQGGSTVVVTIVSTSVLSGGTVTATGVAIPLPADWPTLPNGTMSSAQTSNVTLTATAPNSAWRGSISYRASGTNLQLKPLTKGTSLNAKATIVSCDLTPPTLDLPADMTVEAAGPDGIVVAYEATATDAGPGGLGLATVVPVTCTPVSGSTFSLGVTLVECTATDAVGNVAHGTFTIMVVDTTAPAVTISADPSVSGWVEGPVTVAVTASDAVGVATIEVSLDGTGWSTYTGPMTVEADGTHVIDARALDAAGNVGTAQASLAIDATAPSVTISTDPAVSGWATGPVAVSVTATDAVGVVVTEISVDGGAWSPYTGPVVLEAEGLHDVGARAADEAGHVGTAELSLAIDATPPTVTVTGVADGATYELGSVPGAGCATEDAGSGVAVAATLAMSGDPTAAGSYTATCDGATDVAGNAAPPVASTFTVSAPEPEPDPDPESTIADGGQVLAPVASSQTKVVSRGRTVPFRFRLVGDEPDGLPMAGWQVLRVRVDCAHPTTEVGNSVAPSTSGRGLRYRGDRYLFEADFRDQPGRSCWRLRVVFDDGSALTSGPFRISGPADRSPGGPESEDPNHNDRSPGDRPERGKGPKPDR